MPCSLSAPNGASRHLAKLTVSFKIWLCGKRYRWWHLPERKYQCICIFYYLPTQTPHAMVITHWGRVTHIRVSKLTTIGSDNGLSPVRRQAIIWTNAIILLIGPLGTNFSETLIEIYAFSFNNMQLKISSGKWPPFCLGLNVLTMQDKRVFVFQSWNPSSWKTRTRLFCIVNTIVADILLT